VNPPAPQAALSTSGAASGSDAAVQVRNVRKFFGRTEVLRGVSLDVRAGTVTCVVGPSGSGKSTLLRCINRLEVPTSGTIVVNGMVVTDPTVNIDAIRARIGMVFQHFNLFPHMSVLDNVALALQHVKRLAADEARRIGRERLAEMGIAEFASRWPRELSGGQQQRVAMARALVTRPALILADEPTGALDTRTSEEIMALLQNLNLTQGMTVVLVTHEPDIAEHAGRIIQLRDGLISSDERVAQPRQAAAALTEVAA
jgi:polar amino acid transport system ATP-binding protein